MNRRDWLRGLLTLTGLGLVPGARAARSELRIQDSPVAGFQYYDGDLVWDRLRVGDGLTLRREADNRYDHRAVAVWWRDHQLGYLPRIENHAVAQMLDRGLPLTARIDALATSADPWQRLRLSIHFSQRMAWG
ncbi:MAG: HIRAN domain-containing protein [Chromatiales bacterium]|nr:HIRAN domain-containing protein [Zoogloeaceae bacterium]MCP5352271.1 HIRAN domain-containing protein [Chromatiales bacterium]